MKEVTVLAAKRLGIAYCNPQTTMASVAEQMCTEDISSLVVVDAQGYLKGIISRTDVLRAALARPEDWRQSVCADWMTTDVISVSPDTLLKTAAGLLQDRHVHRVVVAQAEGDRLRPLAVVSDSDIVYHLAQGNL